MGPLNLISDRSATLWYLTNSCENLRNIKFLKDAYVGIHLASGPAAKMAKIPDPRDMQFSCQFEMIRK